MEDIIFLKPAFSHTVWGGTRIRTDFGYEESGDDIGECWGISAHQAGDCELLNGSNQGKTLSWLYANCPDFFGNCKEDVFPLLVKIIDARDNLSIQVHPDDEYAKIHENGAKGKTECWYIIDCPQEAQLVVGHNATTREELRTMIEAGQWDKLIRRVPISKGDFIQIDAGTVHAITKGCLILETQQNSNITYRLYDYDRKPARQLHLEQSIDTIEVPAKEIKDSVIHVKENFIYRNDFYEVEIMSVIDERLISGGHFFQNISVIEGEGQINGYSVKKGDNMIAKAGQALTLSGNMKVVRSTCAG